ncbi:MAG: alpha/beta hydrolase [Geminicoccaceae bacterium]
MIPVFRNFIPIEERTWLTPSAPELNGQVSLIDLQHAWSRALGSLQSSTKSFPFGPILLLIGIVCAIAWRTLNFMEHDVNVTDTGNIETAIEHHNVAYRPKPCWFELSDEKRDGRRISCGEFAVLEHWEKPDSRHVHLPVVTFHADTTEPEAQPVLYIEGGPGQRSDIRTGETIESTWIPFLRDQPWTAEHDFIVMSQRGTNWHDSNLDCPHTDYAACLESLGKTYDLSGYNISQDARDIAALRIAMGIDNWTLLGVSYGTRRALRVMRDYPAGIENVVLDSVVPLDLDPLGTLAPNFAEALDRVFQACREHEGCRHSYPRSEKQLTNVLIKAAMGQLKIVGDPNYETLSLKHTPSAILEILFFLAYSHETTGLIPAYIDALERGYDEQGYVAEVEYLFARSFDGFAEGASVLQPCNDDFEAIVEFDWQADALNYPILRDWIAESAEGTRAICERFSTAPLSRSSHYMLVSDIPTLLLSGYFDPITPSSEASRAANALLQSHEFVFHDKNHSVLFDISKEHTGMASCPAKIMTAFLDKPEDRPIDACLERASNIKFGLPE